MQYRLQDPSIKTVPFSVLQNGLDTIRDHFEQINRVIDNCVETNQTVLIHCVYGMTRSCSCAIAYTMWKDRVPFENAYRLVKSKRTECDLSYEYESYLRAYEEELFNNATHSFTNFNAVLYITGDQGKGKELLDDLNQFSKVHNTYRVGTSLTEEPIYSVTRYCIPIFVAESEDWDCFAAELDEFLQPRGIQDVRVEPLID